MAIHKQLDNPTTVVPMMEQPPTWVVSGTHDQFIDFVKKKRAANDWTRYQYVVSANSIRGLSEIKGVFIGTWKDRKDIKDIREQIDIIKSRTSTEVIEKELDPVIPTTITSGSILTNSSISSTSAIWDGSSISPASIKNEQWFKDMMREYIDEALKNPSTRGGI